ncbi:MAG: YbbR-like domain-containing protein [Oscillospiraceae bacterium]
MNFKGLKNKLYQSFTANPALIIYSVIIAVILWFVISITIYPTTPKTISNIPVEIDITGTSAEENGLSVISYETKKVNVTIKGNRSSIGSLSADDLTAQAVVENVTSAGEKNLKINVTAKKSDVKFEVTNVSPATMTVMFDSIDTREFELSVEAPNVKASDGMYMDSNEFKCTPSVIEISGPSTQLDSIEKAAVVVSNEQELDTAYTFHSSEVVLYDKNDSKIDTKNISFGTDDFTIDIPVYMQKKLDLSYDIRYAPSNFDVDSLGLELSVDSINLASPNTDLQKIDSWNFGSIPLYDIGWDFNKSFPIEIPENYKDLSNVSSVTVKLNTDGLAKKTVTVNDISILNAPSDYNCTVNSYGLVFDIIGPEDDIADITEKDILVSVDLLKYTIQSNNFTADATISFPNYDKVWAVGLQKVSIEAEPVSSASSSSSDE